MAIAAAGILAAALGGLWWSHQGRQEISYQTVAVTRGDVVRSVSATGTVNPELTVIVGSYVPDASLNLAQRRKSSLKRRTKFAHPLSEGVSLVRSEGCVKYAICGFTTGWRRRFRGTCCCEGTQRMSI